MHQFPQLSISEWKTKRSELQAYVQNSEHTGEEVDIAAGAIAEQLRKCELCVKKLEANLEQIRGHAQSLVIHQPPIPQALNLSPPTSHAMRHQDILPMTIQFSRPCEMTPQSISFLAYEIAQMAISPTDKRKADLKPLIASQRCLSLEDLTLSWIIITVLLGRPTPHSNTNISTTVFFEIIRRKSQPAENLTVMLNKIGSVLGLQKVQSEAELMFGSIWESDHPHKWLALKSLNELSTRYVELRLCESELAEEAKKCYKDSCGSESFVNLVKQRLEGLCEDLKDTLMHPPRRSDIVNCILAYVAKLDVGAQCLFTCATRCALSDDERSPLPPVVSDSLDYFTLQVLSTCADSIASTSRSVICHSQNELLSQLMIRFCTLATELEDHRWREVVLGAIAIFYSRLLLKIVTYDIELATIAVAFVTIALDNLEDSSSRATIEGNRTVKEALISLRAAQPKGYIDKTGELYPVLQKMSPICCHLFRNMQHDSCSETETIGTKDDECSPSHPADRASSIEGSKGLTRILPPISVSRSILDLASSTGNGESPPSQKSGASPAVQPPLPEESNGRFSFDTLLRQSGQNLLSRGSSASGDTVASLVGKLTAWGRRVQP